MLQEVPAVLRRMVETRAGQRCKYCWLPQKFAAHRHEPDHIVPIQHGGTTDKENLALACFRCNCYKGPNVGSFDPNTGRLTAFFHPRRDRWNEHFELRDAEILPLTPEGRATVKILRLNDEERMIDRKRLIDLGLFFL
jgi:hypothetical protein